MKTYELHNAICFAFAGIVALCALCSCHLEPPGPLPEEELYVRAFVKNFGVISPDHTWSEAVATQVTVQPDEQIDNLDVYVKVNEDVYLVAQYAEVAERVTIPVDVPAGCDQILVVADGVQYSTNIGGVVKISNSSRAPGSSASDIDVSVTSDGLLSWLIIAEDMATTQEFDFNDIVVRISLLRSNGRRTENGFSSALIRVTAMAAGGTLPLYLHLKDSHGDRVLGPDGPVDISDADALNACEWHKWFRSSAGLPYSSTTMVNTGPSSVDACYTLSTELVVDEDFSMSTFSRYGYYGSIADSDYFAHNVSTGVSDVSQISGFYITVGAPLAENSIGVLCAAAPGVPPQMMLIPDLKPTTIEGAEGWMWPTERTDIRTVYPDFIKWLTNQDTRWYLTPRKNVSSQLYRSS